jgi:hypothetical protein
VGAGWRWLTLRKLQLALVGAGSHLEKLSKSALTTIKGAMK